MSIHGAVTPIPDEDDDYRSQFVTNAEGRIEPRLLKNIFTMLRGHPATRDLFKRDDARQIILAKRPPWDGTVGEWRPRLIEQGDYSYSKMFLECEGLRPSKSEVKDVIDLIAK